MPDIYMERGGGELAAHVDAGLTRDLTDEAADEIEAIGGSVAGWQVDDRTYALPFSLGVVGVWYNTDDFDQAGVTPAHHDGRVGAGQRLARGRRAHAPVASVPATSGRPPTTGTTPRCARAPRTC